MSSGETSVTERLKRELWRRFGDPGFPAEWDGTVYGGGKLSQRFWEYFQTIVYLDPGPDAVILDIGGGSPITGYGFFSHVLHPHVRQVVICDPNAGTAEKAHDNITLIRENADEAVLRRVLAEHPITHIASVSVFEHVDPEVRKGMIRAIDDVFTGEAFVATYEYHPLKKHFEEQLTTKSASELFSGFRNLYLTEYTASPTHCENAFARRGLPGAGSLVPQWYPVAVKFVRP